MRVILNIVIGVGLILLVIRFFFDIGMQSPGRELGYVDYYFPALMTIIFIVWAMILLGLRKNYGKGFRPYKLILVVLLTYTIVWQVGYLKWMTGKNLESTTVYITELFPIVVAVFCCVALAGSLIVGMVTPTK